MKVSGIKYCNIESKHPAANLMVMTIINHRFQGRYQSSIFISAKLILFKYGRDRVSVYTGYYQPYSPIKK